MKMSLSRVLAAGVAAAGMFSVAYAQEVKEITGAGASFPAPLYAKWAADYYKATGVKVNYQSVGSGAGLKQIEAKTVAFGASDMPLKEDELEKKGLVQFPTVIGGVVPVVNIKGIEPGKLKLNGQVLGDIYLGKIYQVERSCHRGAEPGRGTSRCSHIAGAPCPMVRAPRSCSPTTFPRSTPSGRARWVRAPQ